MKRADIAVEAQPERLLSLDVLRGLTVAGMVLVTDPGTYTYVFPQLRHAVWNDPTATDLIFPCFLVVVGISMTLSFAARLRRGTSPRALGEHAVRRSLWLIGIGLVVNGFPEYHLHTLRFPGILQRIGLCYLLASLLYLLLAHPAVSSRTRRFTIAAAAVFLLAAYWALLKLYPTPGFGPGRLDSLGSLPAVLDRAIFSVPHMWEWGKTPGYGVTFDPEGLLSTLGALATVLFGVLAGEVLQAHAAEGSDCKQECGVLAVLATLLWVASLLLRRWMPLNKQIYTPTFALWSAGLSLLAFAGLFWLVDILRVRRGWTLPLIFGTNAIFAFALSQFITGMLTVVQFNTRTGTANLHSILYRAVFASWLPGEIGSLVYAIAIVLLNAAVILPLYRRRVFLRL